MCIFIWEWLYAKQFEPQDTRRHFGGFRGSHIQKSGRLSNGWNDWHQIWYTSTDSFGNGHRLIQFAPRQWGGGGLGGHKFKSPGRCQTAGPIGTKFGTHMQIHLGMDRRQTNWPERHNGALGGVLVGETFKSQGKLSNGWTVGTNFGSGLRIHLGMGIG